MRSYVSIQIRTIQGSDLRHGYSPAVHKYIGTSSSAVLCRAFFDFVNATQKLLRQQVRTLSSVALRQPAHPVTDPLIFLPLPCIGMAFAHFDGFIYSLCLE